ncbi:MAG: bis(5'-nucleosyl)-tetraphosphatase (symmetrical) YqeK [Limnochordaceae bacterium]|nr:bis(5'-nucleosyl)-tetraphosphatase (symmetrical) YqeK [Limnochordaceae bacterium]
MGWSTAERSVRAMVAAKRWRHVAGVVEMARELAALNGVDVEAAALAGLLHDAARDWDRERLRQAALEWDGALDPIEWEAAELLHGPAAASWARRELGVEDREVLAAVRFHTTGRPEPSPIEMVLVVADYSEPSREFSEAVHIREVARHDLLKAYRLSLDARLRYLLDTGKVMHPRTVAARNWALLARAGDRHD